MLTLINFSQSSTRSAILVEPGLCTIMGLHVRNQDLIQNTGKSFSVNTLIYSLSRYTITKRSFLGV